MIKDGYGPTATPVDIAADDLPNGSIKVTLAGLPNDVVNLRNGSSLNGDVMSMDLDSVVIRADGKDQKIDRNQVNKIFLVERILTHVQSPDSQTKAKPQGTTSQTPQLKISGGRRSHTSGSCCICTTRIRFASAMAGSPWIM